MLSQKEEIRASDRVEMLTIGEDDEEIGPVICLLVNGHLDRVKRSMRSRRIAGSFQALAETVACPSHLIQAIKIPASSSERP